MRISELAERVGIPVSTVRYYERVGLIPMPPRTPAGYRAYDETSYARVLFVRRARHMGLSCDQIAEVLPIWDGVNCAATHEQITTLVDAKREEIRERIAELERFADQLDEVQAALLASPPPAACRPDLSCCLPDTEGEPAPVALLPRSHD